MYLVRKTDHSRDSEQFQQPILQDGQFQKLGPVLAHAGKGAIRLYALQSGRAQTELALTLCENTT